MVQIVWYLNSPPSHGTLPFEYWTLILSGFEINPVFRCSVFRWLLYYDFLKVGRIAVCKTFKKLLGVEKVGISMQHNLIVVHNKQ